jgi:hypothetical protein
LLAPGSIKWAHPTHRHLINKASMSFTYYGRQRPHRDTPISSCPKRIRADVGLLEEYHFGGVASQMKGVCTTTLSTLAEGHLLPLERELLHDVEVLGQSAFLPPIAWGGSHHKSLSVGITDRRSSVEKISWMNRQNVTC